MLRCLDKSLKWFNSLPTNIDVFVVTSQEYREDAKKLFNLKGLYIVDDDPFQMSIQNQLLTFEQGSSLLQYHKLWISIVNLKHYVKQNKVKYDSVYKIRTDLYDYNFDISSISEKEVHIMSDLIFAFSYKNINFFEHYFFTLLLKYYNRSSIVMSLDFNIINKSDYDCGRFLWLRYPNSLFNGVKNIGDIKSKVKEIVNSDITSNKADITDTVFCLQDNYQSKVVQNEASFLGYLIENKFIVKKLSYDYLNLRVDRNLESLGFKIRLKNYKIFLYKKLNLSPFRSFNDNKERFRLKKTIKKYFISQKVNRK